MSTAANIVRRRRTRRERKQVKQNRNRTWTYIVLVLLGVLVVIPSGVTLGATLVIYASAVKDLPKPEQSLALSPALGTTKVYDRTGQTLLLEDQSGQERQWITLDQLPSPVLQATLLAEDPKFLNAGRFDPLGTMTRIWQNMLFGPLPVDTTLTGRLVRNVIAPISDTPSVDDVGREIALVAEIERRYTPQQILEWHLNTDDYGNQAYGIEAAAQTYLGKHAVDLTLDEAAILAAIPLAPQYNPFDNETAARGRQLDLLRSMRSAGNITPDQFDRAGATVTAIQSGANQPEQIAPELTAYARRQAQDILDAQGRDGARLVARGGLTIITTLDVDLYYQSQCALQTQLARLQGAAPPTQAGDGQACRIAALLPDTNPFGEGAPDSGSLVLVDVTTGEILSMVGAATTLDNQPGPTLLPFVYFAGLIGTNFNPASMVLDIPNRFPGSVEGLIYQPQNSDGRFRGPINLRDALSAWLLPPAVQIANAEGLENVLRYAHRIGLNSLGEDGRYNLSLLERQGRVSLLDMTYAYSVFATMGDMRGVPAQSIGRGYRQRNPVAVLRIEDGDGNTVWEYTPESVSQNQIVIFKHGPGYLLNTMLSDNEPRRTLLGDTSAVELPRKAAVVNGLAGENAEDWTVGYTPQIVTGVHLNRSDGAALSLDPLGMDGAATVWRAVMQYIHQRDNLPVADWERPVEEVVSAEVCDRSGLLPNGICPTRQEVFLPGRVPLQADTYWQQVEINRLTNQRATATTPRESRLTNLYFIPPPEAADWWAANNQPLPPDEYDTISRPDFLGSVQILQPQQYAYVGQTVDIRGSLDPTDMQYYQLSYSQAQSPNELFQIGERQTEYNRGSTLGTWDTSNLSGFYNIILTVVRGDNTAEQAVIPVIVDNTAPLISLSAGDEGQVFQWPVDTAVPLNANVQDDYAIDRVEFYHNGQFLGTDTDAPYGFSWNITRTGTETFSAVAFDKVGNQSSSGDITVEIGRG